ncbi:hypothetical protein VZO05_13280 [Aggregatilineales bacterium SYSU G02658]
MPKRDQFLADLAPQGRQAALLLAQVGGMPTELQLIVQVAQFDEAAEGLRPVRTYIVRVLGALEHRIANLGTTTDDVTLTDDHPLLYAYSSPAAALFFRGSPPDPALLALDIAQEHALTFRGWRHFPDYLNTRAPLLTLLASGGGLLGQMPLPLAERLARALEAHGLETKLMQDAPPARPPVPDQRLQALMLGESYFLSWAFSFDEMGKA